MRLLLMKVQIIKFCFYALKVITIRVIHNVPVMLLNLYSALKTLT